MTKQEFKEIVIAEWSELSEKPDYKKHYKRCKSVYDTTIDLSQDTIMIQCVDFKKKWHEGAIVIVSWQAEDMWFAHWLNGDKVIKTWKSYDYEEEK